MNLAGPRTGLEMMTPLGSTHADLQLLQRGRLFPQPDRARQDARPSCWRMLDQRMEVHLKKAGSIEFAQIFDEVMPRR